MEKNSAGEESEQGAVHAMRSAAVCQWHCSVASEVSLMALPTVQPEPRPAGCETLIAGGVCHFKLP